MAQHGVGRFGGGAAQRHTEGEEVPHEGGDDLVAGLLGGSDDDDPGRPAPRDQVPERLGQLVALVAFAAPHVEGQLVDGHHVEPELAAGFDLAQTRGQQGAIAAVHLGPEIFEDANGRFHVGPDEVLGHLGPRGQFDLFAVEQGQPHRRVESSRRNEQGQRGGLARSGFAPQQEVALGQTDPHRVPLLVNPEGDGLPQVPVGTGHGGAATDRASRQMIEKWAIEALRGSRRTRTSRAPMVAASDSLAPSISLALNPAGIRSSNRCPAAMFSVDLMVGIWPWRLITPQETKTLANHRRIDWLRSPRASRDLSRDTRQKAMPTLPTNSVPMPDPSRAMPIRHRAREPPQRTTSSPHPRTASAIRE